MLQLIPIQGARGWARTALTLGTATMMTAWLTIWIALLRAAATTPLFPGPVQEAVMLGGALTAQWLLSLPLGERWVRGSFPASAVLAVLLAVWATAYRAWLPIDPRWLSHAFHAITAPSGASPAPALALATLVLWWIGGWIGGSTLDDYEVFRFFGAGLAGLFGALIVSAMAGMAGTLGPMLGLATTLFFAAALLTLPLAQLVAVRERSKAAGAHVTPIDRRWIVTAGGGVLVILAPALLLTATISGRLLSAIADGLRSVADLIGILLFPVILAAAYLVGALVWLVERLRGTPKIVQPKTPRVPHPQQARPMPHSTGHLPSFIAVAAEWIALVVIVVLVIALLSRTVRRAGGRHREQAFEEERDSVWSWDEARTGWRTLAERMRDRFRRPAGRGEPDTGPPRTVREAYRRLLRYGAALGRPRATAETPQEYLGQLRRVPLPDERDAALLTAAYMRARYGEGPEAPEDIQQAIHAWERLERAMQPPDQGSRA